VEALGPNASGYGYRSGLAADHDVVILDKLWHYHGILSYLALHSGQVP
jgi:hypothetical protein